MTKKHFEMIARQIKAQLDFTQSRGTDDQKLTAFLTLQNLTTDLATDFAANNDRFDFDRFRKACGF